MPTMNTRYQNGGVIPKMQPGVTISTPIEMGVNSAMVPSGGKENGGMVDPGMAMGAPVNLHQPMQYHGQ